MAPGPAGHGHVGSETTHASVLGPILVELERCVDCERDHPQCTHHSEEKYSGYAKMVQEEVEMAALECGLACSFVVNAGPLPEDYPMLPRGARLHPAAFGCARLYKASKVKDENGLDVYPTIRYPRLGAFEVYVKHRGRRQRVFSKLDKEWNPHGYWPRPTEVADRVRLIVQSAGRIVGREAMWRRRRSELSGAETEAAHREKDRQTTKNGKVQTSFGGMCAPTLHVEAKIAPLQRLRASASVGLMHSSSSRFLEDASGSRATRSRPRAQASSSLGVNCRVDRPTPSTSKPGRDQLRQSEAHPDSAKASSKNGALSTSNDGRFDGSYSASFAEVDTSKKAHVFPTATFDNGGTLSASASMGDMRREPSRPKSALRRPSGATNKGASTKSTFDATSEDAFRFGARASRLRRKLRRPAWAEYSGSQTILSAIDFADSLASSMDSCKGASGEVATEPDAQAAASENASAPVTTQGDVVVEAVAPRASVSKGTQFATAGAPTPLPDSDIAHVAASTPGDARKAIDQIGNVSFPDSAVSEWSSTCMVEPLVQSQIKDSAQHCAADCRDSRAADQYGNSDFEASATFENSCPHQADVEAIGARMGPSVSHNQSATFEDSGEQVGTDPKVAPCDESGVVCAPSLCAREPVPHGNSGDVCPFEEQVCRDARTDAHRADQYENSEFEDSAAFENSCASRALVKEIGSSVAPTVAQKKSATFKDSGEQVRTDPTVAPSQCAGEHVPRGGDVDECPLDERSCRDMRNDADRATDGVAPCDGSRAQCDPMVVPSAEDDVSDVLKRKNTPKLEVATAPAFGNYDDEADEFEDSASGFLEEASL